MVAPNNSPVVSTIGLTGPKFSLGDVTNQFQPTTLTTWNVVIPDVLLGNEVIAGYAAFTADGSTITRGASGYGAANFVGFVQNQYFNEGDPGSNPYTITVGSKFQVSVLSLGGIYVYNSTAIAATVSSGLSVVLTVTSGTTPAAIKVGSVIQGATPDGATVLDVSSFCRVKTAQTTVGAGCLIELIKV